jgi:exosortase
LLLAVLLLGFTFFETLVDLNTLWQFNNEAFSHGYLVLGLVLYTLYERRDLFVLKPTFSVLPFALLAGIAWTVANTVNIKLGEYLILPFILLLLITSAVGWKKSLHFVLPISALYFALPIIGYVNPVLQTMTVKVVTAMVRMTDMAAHIDGFYITLPYGVLHVADSCSGLSYLSAGITFTMLYAFLNIRRKRLKALAIGFMIILSLLANWIRVFILVAIGHESQMQSPLVKEHGFLGWVIFACAFGLFLYVIRLLENRYDEADIDATTQTKRRNAHNSIEISSRVFAHSTAPLVLAFLVAALPLYSSFSKDGNYAKNASIKLPYALQHANITPYENLDTVLFQNADLAMQISGTHNSMLYDIFTIAYIKQTQGKELIHYKNKLGEELKKRKMLQFDNLLINYAFEEKTQRHVFWFYKIGNTEVSTSLEAKFAQLQYMFDQPTALALVVKIKCFENCDMPIVNPRIKGLIESVRKVAVSSE